MMNWNEDDYVSESDHEFDQANDYDEDELVTCVECKTEFLEEAEICPNCGRFFMEGDRPSSSNLQRNIIVIIMLLALLLPIIAGVLSVL